MDFFLTSIIHFFIHLFNDAKIEDEKKFLKLNDVEAYKISFHLSNYVGDIVLKRDYFAKKKIRVQSVDGADSISANIAEGFGRHFKKDKVNF